MANVAVLVLAGNSASIGGTFRSVSDVVPVLTNVVLPRIDHVTSAVIAVINATPIAIATIVARWWGVWSSLFISASQVTCSWMSGFFNCSGILA